MQSPTFSQALLALDAAVLDTETTGLDARTARVIQIAAVTVEQGRLVDVPAYDTLVDPGVAVPAASTRVHGISTEQLKGQPAFAEVAPALEDYVGSRIVVGHTIGYDMTVLAREYAKAGRPFPAWRTLDVRHLARLAAPSLADHSLDRLCEWLCIVIEGRHTARGDAEATARVFLALIPKLREKNIRTIAEAEAASKALAENEAAAGARPFDVAGPPTAPALQRIDAFAYRTRVADIMSAPPLLIEARATLNDALSVLMSTGASSVFVRLDDGSAGIITERDVLRAVAGKGGAALGEPAAAHAKAPLQTVGAHDHLFRALGRMNRLNIRHLGVVDARGELVGAVTTRNLLKHRASTANMLGDAIDSALSAADLAAAWARLAPMARSLMADDVQPRAITGVISAEIAAMTARAAALAVTELEMSGRGAPPQPFAVLILGSGGRGESQLAADQDNAIVYAEGKEGSAGDEWFKAMAIRMTDILDQAGIPLCKGGVMARNRAWRMDVEDWTATIDGWVRRQRPEDLLNVDIFFDALPVYGARDLGDRIWSHAYERAHASRSFQGLLTESARAAASPFTLFGGFRTDQHGRLDLKRYGLMPLFTAARVLSIRHDVRKRSSAERMTGVGSVIKGDAEMIERIVGAQETLLGFVVAQQLLDIEAGVPPSTRVAIARLDAHEKASLKAALSAVADAVDLVSEGRV